jgi:Flp pilus assembly protein TadD
MAGSKTSRPRVAPDRGPRPSRPAGARSPRSCGGSAPSASRGDQGIGGSNITLPLLAIAALGLGLRGILLSQLHDHPLLQPGFGLDTDLYITLAQRVAGGDLALAPGAYPAAPLYIYALGAMLAAGGGSLLAARVVQILLGAVAVWLVGDAARRVFGPAAALPAALLAALCGPFAFNEVLLLQSALDPVLTALALWTLARALEAATARPWLVAGIAWAALAVNRPNALPFLAVIVFALAWSRRRHALGPVVALAAGAALVIAPVALRNLAVTGEFVLIAAHGGFNFFVGNNPEADGTYRSVEGVTPSSVRQQADARVVAEEVVGRPLSDGEVSSYFYQRAFDWIASSPADAAALALRKIWYAVSAGEISLNYSYAYYRGDEPTVLRGMPVSAWLLLPLGLVGLVACRRGGEYWIWAGFVPVYALSVAVFFVSDRYRMPLLVPVAMSSGALLGRLVAFARTGEWLRVARVGAVTALVAVGTSWPTGLDDGRGEERTAMAETLIRGGEVTRGQQLADRALPGHREPALMLFRVGRALQARGERRAAIARYEQALSHDPDRAEIRYVLGQCLLDDGRVAEAIPHLDAAVTADVRPDVAPFDLARALASTHEYHAARRALARLRIPDAADITSFAGAGQLAETLGDGALAIRFYARAADRPDATVAMLERLGVLLAMSGRSDEAVTVIERAVVRAPGEASLRLNLAVALAQAGRLQDARAQVGEALRLRPDYPQARALEERLRGS